MADQTVLDTGADSALSHWKAHGGLSLLNRRRGPAHSLPRRADMNAVRNSAGMAPPCTAGETDHGLLT